MVISWGAGSSPCVCVGQRPMGCRVAARERKMRFVLLGIALLGLPCNAAAAQLPSALVEQVAGAIAGPELLDYVSPGQVVQLGPSGTIILAYLDSCTRELITGGEVTIGLHGSQVKGGEIKRENPPCNRTAVSTAMTSDAAGAVFRGRPTEKRVAESWRASIHSQSPIFEISESGTMVLKRIDQPGERYEIAVSPASLVKGRFYDLAAGDRRLKPGGRYEVSLGANRLILQVDQAAFTDGPLLARLVRLTPPKADASR